MSQPPLPRLKARAADSHKGSFGSALLIGGSRGMTGAIALSGLAALRGGAGLVRLAVPNESLPIVAGIEPSYITVPLAADAEGRIALAARERLVELAAESTAIGCGPGLGRSDELVELVAWLYENLKQPAVFDADALFALAARPASLARAGGPRILTPHPGEFLRLIGHAKKLADHERAPLAEDLARRSGAVVILKGHHSVITSGGVTVLNETGNPGMATGGTGDVLTGLVTALLCQGLSPFDAARLAAHAHGLAGDLAAAELGQTALMASDLIAYLPRAWQALDSGG